MRGICGIAEVVDEHIFQQKEETSASPSISDFPFFCSFNCRHGTQVGSPLKVSVATTANQPFNLLVSLVWFNFRPLCGLNNSPKGSQIGDGFSLAIGIDPKIPQVPQ